jgi:hypothetical protein
LDIGVVEPVDLPFPDAGGLAGAASQDAFCANTTCVITLIYDQSGKGNHLVQAAPDRPFRARRRTLVSCKMSLNWGSDSHAR